MFNTLTNYLLGSAAATPTATPVGNDQTASTPHTPSSEPPSKSNCTPSPVTTNGNTPAGSSGPGTSPSSCFAGNGSHAGERADSPGEYLLVTNLAGSELVGTKMGAPGSGEVEDEERDNIMGVEDEWIYVDVKASDLDPDESNSAELVSLPRSSVPSTPASGWNLTPPACFEGVDPSEGDSTLLETARGILETSNFENLLIEHPSKSVYHCAFSNSTSASDSDVSRKSSDNASSANVSSLAGKAAINGTNRPEMKENIVSSTAGNGRNGAVNSAQSGSCATITMATRSSAHNGTNANGATRRRVALSEWLSPSSIAQFDGSQRTTTLGTITEQRAELTKTRNVLGTPRKMERSNRARAVDAAGRLNVSRSKKLKTFGNSGKNNDRKCQ